MESSISITFGRDIDDPDDPDDPESEACRLILELDDAKNEGATTFVVGSKAYLRFLSSSRDSYTIKVSSGTGQVENTKIPYPVSNDEVAFVNAKTGSLSYLPSGEVSWEWKGNSAGTPLFNGREVTLSSASVAMLNCDYDCSGDRLSIRDDEVGSVIVVVIQGENQASITVNFESDPEDPDDPDPTPEAYELEVKDYCSDGILAGVTVYFDGVDIGQTNASGIIALGGLRPGSSHTLKMAKDGYMNSESDKLNNDSFTVPN